MVDLDNEALLNHIYPSLSSGAETCPDLRVTESVLSGFPAFLVNNIQKQPQQKKINPFVLTSDLSLVLWWEKTSSLLSEMSER